MMGVGICDKRRREEKQRELGILQKRDVHRSKVLNDVGATYLKKYIPIIKIQEVKQAKSLEYFIKKSDTRLSELRNRGIKIRF